MATSTAITKMKMVRQNRLLDVHILSSNHIPSFEDIILGALEKSAKDHIYIYRNCGDHIIIAYLRL